MSLRRDDLDDAQDDALGLASTYPRPGWVVLDAVRERCFTGEVVCRTTPGVTVWADRGVIYLAERDDDPALGRRLVEAGALTEAQLAAGAMQVNDDEYLALLFERATDVDRHAVIVTNQLLTDDCIGWLASQRVHGAIVTPYHHHPSGAHRWRDDQPASPFAPPVPSAAPVPGPPPPFAPPTPAAVPATMPPPAPPSAPPPSTPAPSTSAPLAPAPPARPVTSLITPLPMPGRNAPSEQRGGDLDVDDVIRWDEPGWLEQPLDGDRSPGRSEPLPVLAHDGDRRSSHRPQPEPVEPPSPAAVLSAAAADTFERFEVIWPSGEIDEQFGGQSLDVSPDPDVDRAGPTARLVRDGGTRGVTAEAVRVGDVADAVVEYALGDGVADIESFLADQATRNATTDVVDDDVLSAVREAVAEIEAGALVQRERRVGPRSGVVLDGGAAAPAELRRPGRVALRDTAELPVTSTGRTTRPNPSAGSVFDEVPPLHAPAAEASAPAADVEPTNDRASALRRLIGSLKRR